MHFSRPQSFNTQPPEGGWLIYKQNPSIRPEFQHTAARRRLVRADHVGRILSGVSTHSRPKAAGSTPSNASRFCKVSTHSRPKAAGWQIEHVRRSSLFQHTAARRRLGPFGCHFLFSWLCFNTQPPEGGWQTIRYRLLRPACFNTQPPEGGW